MKDLVYEEMSKRFIKEKLVKINLNQKVKFKLTKIGREYLKKNKLLMWSDKEGYSTEQLWVVMGSLEKQCDIRLGIQW